MEEKVYTVQEIIEYFEGQTGERFNTEIESFARGNAQNARAYRNLMRERRSVDVDTSGICRSDGGKLGVIMDGRSRELVSADHVYSAEVQEARTEGIPAEYDIVVEEDNIDPVTRGVQDVHTTDLTEEDCIVYEEEYLKDVKEISSDAVIQTADVGVEHISGVTGGDVDNSTVVGVVKGGMRNKQTVVDSDICITGSRGAPDGHYNDADHKLKEVAGVTDGVVKDSTVVGEVHGGMDNEQTIENSTIYSDGSFGGNLQFLDLNIRQRDDCGGQQDGGVQSFKDCIIDLRKPDDATDKDKSIDDAECSQAQTGSASYAAGLSAGEPGDDGDDQDMQIKEVKDRSEREEEERRLMQEKQAAMEEQLLTEQRERQHMQAEMQRISNEQRQNAVYRGHPNPIVVNPTLAAGGFVVAPAVARVVYVKPKEPNKGTGLLKNIKQFINDAQK